MNEDQRRALRYWENDFRGTFLSHTPDAVDHQSHKMIGRDVRVESRSVSIRFPQRKHVRIVLTAADVEADHATFFP